MPATSESEVKIPTDLVSPERAQLLLPKLTDDQLATLRSHGVIEQTSVGQVLATAGDLTYDLMVVLEGEVECSDIHDGRRRPLLVHEPRDFIAELDLLTGQRVYATFVVIQAGSIIRVPRAEVKSIIEVDASLGDLLVQTLFRRREALLLLRSVASGFGVAPAPWSVALRPPPSVHLVRVADDYHHVVVAYPVGTVATPRERDRRLRHEHLGPQALGLELGTFTELGA